MSWKPDVNGDTFKRDDGAVIERSNYSGDSWEAVIRDTNDVRCKLRTKQGHTRRWKSPEAAMRVVDKEFPAAEPAVIPGRGLVEPVPELTLTAQPHLSAVERSLVGRVQVSNGGCFPNVENVAVKLIERGVLTGSPVKNYPNYWQLWLV